MKLSAITYGPHQIGTYENFYFYNETSLQYGMILDDSNDSIGWGVQFEKTATISGVGFYAIEYIGNPDYTFAFVTISGQAGSIGDPFPNVNPTTKVAELYSNSQWQSYEPDVVGSGWNWIDLATPVNVTKGDVAALVVIPSGAVVPNSSNKVELNDESTFYSSYPLQFRFSTYWYSNNWAAPIGIKYTDNSIQGFCLTGLPYEQYVSPEEWGVEFKIPFQATCIGGIFNLYPASSPGTEAPFKLILADNSDVELASVTVPDYDLVDSYNNGNIYIQWDTSNDPILQASTSYRMYLKPTSSEPIDKKGFIIIDEASKSTLPGGTDWKWIERSTPASGWIYQPTYYPWISLILTDIQAGTSGQGSTGQTNSSYGFIG